MSAEGTAIQGLKRNFSATCETHCIFVQAYFSASETLAAAKSPINKKQLTSKEIERRFR